VLSGALSSQAAIWRPTSEGWLARLGTPLKRSERERERANKLAQTHLVALKNVNRP